MSVGDSGPVVPPASGGLHAPATFPSARKAAVHVEHAPPSGAFTVNTTLREDVLHSIDRQVKHHRTRTFREESTGFLRKSGVEFDEQHLDVITRSRAPSGVHGFVGVGIARHRQICPAARRADKPVR